MTITQDHQRLSGSPREDRISVTNESVPVWAIQRVNAVLAQGQEQGRVPTTMEDLARRAGLSKRMTRRCLFHSQKTPAISGQVARMSATPVGR